MNDTIAFLDAGFLSKLSKSFGKGKYLIYDLIKFAGNLAKKQNLYCKHVYYYTAPPFQSEKPTKEEENRKKNYDRFIKKLVENKEITIREGRCQRLKIDGRFIYKQKAVDSLMVMDMLSVPIDYPGIKDIILIASVSDFVPVIKRREKIGIKTTLYTYYEWTNRKSIFSTSNELIKSVDKYIILTRQDFDDSPLNKSLVGG